MKILILGSGGREHAIGKKLLEDNPYINLYFYPGNGGTGLIGKNIGNNYSILDLVFFCKKNNIDTTIVGSEFFLMQKIVDLFNIHNLKIFGPQYSSANLEGNRIFAKSFMEKYGICTPKYNIFSSYKEAISFVKKRKKYPLVIKTNGIAYGKGVIITHNEVESCNELKNIMIDKKFGKSGNKIIIEEYLQGKEVSIISIFNKKNIIPFLSSRDYKKIGENDVGLNTGGMGCIVPNPYMNDFLFNDFKNNILSPTLDGLITEKLEFFGFLYFGLMIYKNRMYLLEYNTRMGDPEAQSLFPLMKNNFLDVLKSCYYGNNVSIQWKNNSSCCVVLSSKGYPKKYKKGNTIKGLKYLEEPFYIAGAERINKEWITSSGRVINIVGISNNIENSRKLAYKKAKIIQFDNIYYRKDIGLL